MLPSFFKTLPLSSVPFVLMLLMFSTTLVVDIYTPCLPDIKLYYGCMEGELRSTLALMSLGSFLTIPLFGPLSDSWGRKKILILSQSIFLLSLIMAIFAPSITILGLARFCQGIGTSGSSSISFAVITDLYPSKKRTMYFSYLIAVLTLSLVIGPLLGGIFQKYCDWKMCFIFVFILSFINFIYLLRFPEPLKKSAPFHFGQAIRRYFHIFCNPLFLGYGMLAPLMIGCLVAYGINGTFYFIENGLMTPQEFSYHQAFMMIANTVSAVLAGRAVRHFGEYFILRLSMGFITFAGITFIGIILRPVDLIPWQVTGVVSIFAFGLGGSSAILSSLSMKIFPQEIGTLTSALSLLRSFGVGLSILISGYVYNNTLDSILSYLTIVSFLIVFTFLFLQRYFPLPADHS
jgi:DHA1 family bicyclomycin/chloramphenicol resistance-like MFS transporter